MSGAKYGSNVDKDGKELRSNGAAPILTGERVSGCKLVSFDFAKEENGDAISTRAEFKFLQPNGATFTFSVMDSTEDWAIDTTNRSVLHICTKIVSEEEYYASISGAANFVEFVTKVKEKIISKVGDKKFTLKIIYKLNKNKGKYYPGFPTFPSFIELDGTIPSTLSTNPQYDLYIVPASSSPEKSSGTENMTKEELDKAEKDLF